MPHRLLVLLPALLLLACDSADKAAPASKVPAKAGDTKADAKVADVKTDDAKTDDAKTDDAKSGHAEAGDAEAAGEAATAFAVPTTAEDAARQLAQRLADPDKTPRARFSSAAGSASLLDFASFFGSSQPEVGVGDNVVNLEQVCMSIDGGKPTAYTRVEVSN